MPILEHQAESAVVVGGGFTGAAVAYHLARLRPGISITVIEPREEIGGGLAYDDTDPTHRINVPAVRMSLIPGDDTHFARWLEETGAADGDEDADRNGALFPRRAVFGRYVRAHLVPLLSEKRVVHVRARATALTREGDRWKVTTDTRGNFAARIVVLAVTHPSPELPSQLKQLIADPRLVPDALVPGVLTKISKNERVLIVGTSLTMADVVATLDNQGHRGEIVALSRRGLRSRGHPTTAAEPFGAFAEVPPRASRLLKLVRQTIREAELQGRSWHAVIDAVRANAQIFWPTLPLAERERIVRHLRAYWDVHRFRVAPQVEEVLDRRLSDGRLRLVASSLVGVRASADDIEVLVRPRKSKRTEAIHVDRIVVTTGPAHGKIFATEPILAGLLAAGRAKPDDLGLGIACDQESRALDSAGHPDEALFVAGPLARATFGELMGLPQVSEHARRVAERVSRALSADEARAGAAAEVG